MHTEEAIGIDGPRVVILMYANFVVTLIAWLSVGSKKEILQQRLRAFENQS